MVFNFRTPSFMLDFLEERQAAGGFSPVEVEIHQTIEMPSKFCTKLSSHEGGLEMPKSFSLRELQNATGNFNHKRVLGEGGFGKVYRGELADGSLVAIKRVKKDAANAETQFETEVTICTNKMASHPNLVRLLGFCCTKNELMLVYPFMVNNSLEQNLRPPEKIQILPLDWQKRKSIALGVARGLSHLHNQFNPKIIHRDISPSNILLDEEFKAVVADFGFARIMNEEDVVEGSIEWSFPEWPQSPYLYKDTYINTSICGTNGFIASEYSNTGKCSQKSDVYAYGNLLLDLITGQESIDINRESSVANEAFPSHWVERDVDMDRVIDKSLQGKFDRAEAAQFIDLGLICADPNPSMRPDMGEVVSVLQGNGRAAMARKSKSSFHYW